MGHAHSMSRRKTGAIVRMKAQGICALLLVFLSTQYGCRPGAEETKYMFSRLALEYESVFVADGALLSGTGSFSGISRESLRKLQVPFAGLIVLFLENTALKSQNLLRAGSVEFVAVGAKDPPPCGTWPGFIRFLLLGETAGPLFS